MKMKMLSMAAAVIMAVTCLTGCSNGIKKDTVIQTAKEYGMVEQDTFEKTLVNRNRGYNVFYVSKDEEEADFIREAFMHVGQGEDFGIKETIWCTENKINHSKIKNEVLGQTDEMLTTILVMTTKDAQSAKKLYEENAEWIALHNGVTGEKGGVTYSINYTAFTTTTGSEAEDFYGVYLSGNTVIWIDALTTVDNIDDCTEFFCEKLGLVSPLTLRK